MLPALSPCCLSTELPGRDGTLHLSVHLVNKYTPGPSCVKYGYGDNSDAFNVLMEL
jgi:hypothetical protein